jgi:hypothetical protein
LFFLIHESIDTQAQVFVGLLVYCITIAMYRVSLFKHGIYCKKSVKTKCQFKKRLGGKKSKIQCQKKSF